jgi:hypothetical protein
MNILLTFLFYLIPFGVWLTGKLMGIPILTWIGFGLGILFTLLSYAFAKNKENDQKHQERAAEIQEELPPRETV